MQHLIELCNSMYNNNNSLKVPVLKALIRVSSSSESDYSFQIFSGVLTKMCQISCNAYIKKYIYTNIF